ncbi:PREDICTED: uncharacterized protein LOC109462613 [Branchiostoma belcheri]|uniref:Uncharacterized protein LOC109462613 n=1 Tax=Branchiostoma belcheri TaxID=7741 RepID=A0A6P4XDV0_BRABE|nr:PREDICTED: uncharacterized protein LOC109462613 [Branchiostoma belcheri]
MDQGDGKEPPLVGYAGTAGKWSMTPIERQESGDRSRSRDSGDRDRSHNLEMSTVGDSSGPDRSRDHSHHKSSKRRKKKKKHSNSKEENKNTNGEVNQAYEETGENRNLSERPKDVPEPIRNHRTPHALPPIQPAQAARQQSPRQQSPRQPFPGRQEAGEDVIVPIDAEELHSRWDVADGRGILGSLGSMLGLGGRENSPGTHLDKSQLSRFVQEHRDQGLHDGSFGEIEFVGLGGYTQRSPYIRVGKDTVRPEALWELMTKHWQLEPPNLLISVTGGAKKFLLKERLKNIFKIGLVKASQSTGAWIITGGMNEGVMKYVGEAIRDGVNSIAGGEQRKMVAIGIATWGTVDNRKSLQGKPRVTTFRGLRIHQGKMKCQNEEQRKRSAPAGQTKEVTDQVTNHSTQDFNSGDPDPGSETPPVEPVPRAGEKQPTYDTGSRVASPKKEECFVRKEKIKWPRASDKATWEVLDSDLSNILEQGLKGDVERKLNKFGNMVYDFCSGRLGTLSSDGRSSEPRRISRRQKEISKLIIRRRHLRKLWRKAGPDEKVGLQVLWEEVRTRLKCLRRAERLRRKRKRKENQRKQFFRNPFKFAKSLLEEKKGGDLTIGVEDLEAHLKATYSDPEKDRPLDSPGYVPRPAEPSVPMDVTPPEME